MKILVACEESQAVTVELRKLGHKAYSCDIIECSGGHPEWHIMQDVLPLLNGNCEFKTLDGVNHKIDGKWDMIIAFPPCTYLTVTGNRWFNVDRYGEKTIQRMKDREDAIKFFMAFANADCDRIAIENPIGVMSTVYRKPMVAVGIGGKFDTVTVLREACLPRGDRIDTERIANACADFCASVREHFGRYDFVFYDAADPTLGNRVAAVLQTRGLPSRNVVASYKVPLEERPVTVDGLLCSGRLKINKTCAGVIRALSQLRWDDVNPNIPEDKNIGNINDYWDAFCYAWSAWWKYFDRRAYGREKG